MQYPPIRLDHLYRMTDSTGIVQHARWNIPYLQSGYTLDDNARAFIVALLHHRSTHAQRSLELAYTYLAFIDYAQQADGNFLNFLPYDRNWREGFGSADANGRAIQALGYGLRYAPDPGMRNAAADMLARTLPHSNKLSPPRATAFALIGFADACLAEWQPKEMREWIRHHANRLVDLFERADDGKWRWFEEGLTYANALLPQAMLVAYEILSDKRYKKVAEASTEFLISQVYRDDILDLIGQAQWCYKNGVRATYDQQPTDAAHAVELMLTAHRVLGESRYYDLALRAMDWFYGKNRGGEILYDEKSGGCCDGLCPNGVNGNQGAESTLAHLMARLLIEESKNLMESEKRHAAKTLHGQSHSQASVRS